MAVPLYDRVRHRLLFESGRVLEAPRGAVALDVSGEVTTRDRAVPLPEPGTVAGAEALSHADAMALAEYMIEQWGRVHALHEADAARELAPASE